MNVNLLAGDADVIKQIGDFATILADWAIAFTNWFITFLGSHMLLIISVSFNVCGFGNWNNQKVNSRSLIFNNKL
ncbi:hypothetical protein [Spiroplasma phoeniceum]|uniref:Spiroplasma plectrovirus-related protein n=1 Tax=Spiroplasma phoeniceum P40 TaxID=1276259 RepID=A0A345DSK2_9MOLU|nr:hypothetical protein [Spiroplasma phoeniceum]AXF97193.1 spiroplasma plectrovirus-related protein [Spiroplasma phoeniceum P40]